MAVMMLHLRKLELDLYYIQNRSLGLHLRILLKTLVVLFTVTEPDEFGV